MTVELVVVFPVVLVVAVIAVNALTFFADCAAFDNALRDLARVYAASPAYGQDLEESRQKVLSTLEGALGRDELQMDVAVETTVTGLAVFTGTLEYSPTLFGLPLKDEVLGVSLPTLRHEVRHAVDVYKPAVVT